MADDQMRRVPQAWLDRAMQIETAADTLVTHVCDAIQRAQEGSGRFYAANIVQVDAGLTAVLEAINLPEPAIPAPFHEQHYLTFALEMLRDPKATITERCFAASRLARLLPPELSAGDETQ